MNITIGYESSGQENIMHSLFGNVKTAENIYLMYRVYLTKKYPTNKCNFEVLSRNKICGDIISGPWVNELTNKGIYLAVTEGTCLLIRPAAHERC